MVFVRASELSLYYLGKRMIVAYLSAHLDYLHPTWNVEELHTSLVAGVQLQGHLAPVMMETLGRG